jgi:hypothetical protein
MELNMTNYIYEVIENGYYEETENWQHAIDLFNHAGPLRGHEKRVRIEVYNLLETGSRYFTTTLRTHTDIHEWSEKLIDNLQANRIERRLMKESLPKPMSWQFEEAAIREAEERENEILRDEMLCSLEECSTELDFHGDFSGMSDEVKDSIINPKHYKIFAPEDYVNYPDGIEYMDLCDKALAHLSGVESHLVGQILKYALRVGKKDAMEQDATKIEWYASRLVNTVKGK